MQVTGVLFGFALASQFCVVEVTDRRRIVVSRDHISIPPLKHKLT